MKPGLTCLWQIRGRNNMTSFDDRVRTDLEYIAIIGLSPWIGSFSSERFPQYWRAPEQNKLIRHT